ncbi:hypothetical protein ACWT_0207 [Actinoplanes sp. SE50]|uniref:hypothetical protein n=1 Tax=unclassified Actinoplanes TaxID=2626549 RepID=UPI00023ED6FD|nr:MULTISPECIES: hypothetical protein [unclassified Actinoplanes]AEV81219.1 hypothetical protein ACPL_322 [Actinoplanes sp. SE50/110]ATO79622.1 hypothetical protein ACWT_0207 [Actinoplanes sp. SE50]SLL97025.1 hypothetical protein ACSP50_0221 [Actinoplanes sp. SE50/110]
MRPIVTRTALVLAVGAGIAATIAAGQPEITKAGLEKALVPTFTNLYIQQAGILGIPGITSQSIGASTNCDKGGPKIADTGAGPNWVCMMSWIDNHGQHQDGKFEVTVHTDATYVAGGPSKIVGLATITDKQGRDVRNPVFEFDGVITTNS